MSVGTLGKATAVWRERGLTGLARAVGRKIAGGYRPGPVGDAWTEYLSWLAFANAGMLVRGNADCFDYAVRNLPSAAPMVEIGSFCGLSTNVLTYLKRKHGAANPLVTCDPWAFEGSEAGRMLGDSPTVSHADYRAFVKETFERNVRFFSRGDLPYSFEATSDAFFAAWGDGEDRRDVFGRTFRLGGPVSFAYVDGHHAYEFARRDFENCDRYLDRGGFLLFDDSGDGSEWEVRKVVREVAATGRYELVARNPNFFFRKLSDRD
jgi:hypothetical protein